MKIIKKRKGFNFKTFQYTEHKGNNYENEIEPDNNFYKKT